MMGNTLDTNSVNYRHISKILHRWYVPCTSSLRCHTLQTLLTIHWLLVRDPTAGPNMAATRKIHFPAGNRNLVRTTAIFPVQTGMWRPNEEPGSLC